MARLWHVNREHLSTLCVLTLLGLFAASCTNHKTGFVKDDTTTYGNSMGADLKTKLTDAGLTEAQASVIGDSAAKAVDEGLATSGSTTAITLRSSLASEKFSAVEASPSPNISRARSQDAAPFLAGGATAALLKPPFITMSDDQVIEIAATTSTATTDLMGEVLVKDGVSDPTVPGKMMEKTVLELIKRVPNSLGAAISATNKATAKSGDKGAFGDRTAVLAGVAGKSTSAVVSYFVNTKKDSSELPAIIKAISNGLVVAANATADDSKSASSRTDAVLSGAISGIHTGSASLSTTAALTQAVAGGGMVAVAASGSSSAEDQAAVIGALTIQACKDAGDSDERCAEYTIGLSQSVTEGAVTDYPEMAPLLQQFFKGLTAKSDSVLSASANISVQENVPAGVAAGATKSTDDSLVNQALQLAAAGQLDAIADHSVAEQNAVKSRFAATVETTLATTSMTQQKQSAINSALVQYTATFVSGTTNSIVTPPGFALPPSAIAANRSPSSSASASPSPSATSTVAVAPSEFSYSGSITAVYAVDVAITARVPIIQNSPRSYAIDKTLPLGLSFDTTLGIISGTPTAAKEVTTYTITATNSAGSTQTTLIISTFVPVASAAPTFSSPAGNYASNQSIALDTVTAGASVYYTVDGSAPSASSTLYSGPISINGDGTTKTIKAIAVKSRNPDSEITSATYAIDMTAPTAAASPTWVPSPVPSVTVLSGYSASTSISAAWTPSISGDVTSQILNVFPTNDCSGTPVAYTFANNTTASQAITVANGTSYTFTVTSTDSATNASTTSCSSAMTINTSVPDAASGLAWSPAGIACSASNCGSDTNAVATQALTATWTKGATGVSSQSISIFTGSGCASGNIISGYPLALLGTDLSKAYSGSDGVVYSFSIDSITVAGNHSATSPCVTTALKVDTTAPPAASSLVWSPNTAYSTDLTPSATWAISDTSDVVSQKFVLYSQTSCGGSGVETSIADNTSHTFQISGSNGNTYSYKVETIDKAGNTTTTSACSSDIKIDSTAPAGATNLAWSPAGNTCNDVTYCGAATGINAVSTVSLQAVWTISLNPGLDVDHQVVSVYTGAGCSPGNIYPGGTYPKTVAASVNFENFTGSNAGTYSFSVVTYDIAGNHASSVPCVSTAVKVDTSAPSAPTSLTVTPTSPAPSPSPVIKGAAITGSDPSAKMVSIYAGACNSGTPWTGPASTFNTAGIQVAVTPGVSTNFYAKVTDYAGNDSSTCAGPIAYLKPLVVTPTITAPTASNTINSSTASQTVSGTCSGTAQGMRVTATRSGSTSGVTQPTFSSNCSSGTTWALSAITLTSTAIVVTVYSSNSVGVDDFDSITMTLVPPPSIRITTNNGEGYTLATSDLTSGSFTISGTCTNVSTTTPDTTSDGIHPTVSTTGVRTGSGAAPTVTTTSNACNPNGSGTWSVSVSNLSDHSSNTITITPDGASAAAKTITLVYCSSFDALPAAVALGGSGTAYTIGGDNVTSVAQLLNVMSHNVASTTITLQNNVDLACYTWVPIGTSSTAFVGTFDGGAKTISNLYINTTSNNQGLFGYTAKAIVKKLSMTGVTVTGGNYVGGLIGQSYQDNYQTGNLANYGAVDRTGPISVKGKLVAKSFGGLVAGALTFGYQQLTYDVSSAGTVTGIYPGDYMGGLFGQSNTGKIFYSSSTANVTSVGNYIGGLVGQEWDQAGGPVAINNCSATGNVSGADYVGGFVGCRGIAPYGGSWFGTSNTATGTVSATGTHKGAFGWTWYPSAVFTP